MNDRDKTKDQLIAELAALRKRLADAGTGEMAPANPRWRSLAANTPLLILILDRQHRIRFINHTDVAGSPEGVVGKSPYEFYPPQYRDAARQCTERVFETGVAHRYEAPVAEADGKLCWYRVHVGPIREDGQVVAVSHIAENVTADKRVQQERDRSHAILNAAIECLPFHFFAIGLDNRYILLNTASKQQYGEIIGKTPEDICPNQRDLAIWRDNNQRAFAGQRVEGEVEFTVQNEKRHYYNVVTPIRHDGELYGILGVNLDITELRKAQTALQESEERYRLLAESSPYPIFQCDAEGRATGFNQRWYEHTGQTPDESRGHGWQAVVHPDDLEHVGRRIREALAGGRSYEAEYRIRRASDGSFRWHLARALPMKDDSGNILCWFGTIVDIHHRKELQHELERRVEQRTAELTKANQQLRRSEERYRSLLEACPDSVLMSDLDGRVLFACPETWRLLGLEDGEELTGRSLVDYVIEQDRQRLAAGLSDLLQAGVHRNRTYTVLRQDRNPVPIEVSSVVIRDDNGDAKAVMGVLRDITERKQAQEALQRERRTLLYMLRASDHDRQTIAYDIHDGLAQQLAAAGMQFQSYDVLKDTDPSAGNIAYQAGVEMVRQAHAEARRLISGVRPPALDEAGVAVALSHLVHGQRQPDGPHIEYHDKVEFDRLAPVLESAIYRIAQEALANACQHSESRKVRLSLVQERDLVHLEVQDQGVGFDPQAVAEDRFGLQGISERARLLGGTCSIHSEPGKGTRVRVTLPILELE